MASLELTKQTKNDNPLWDYNKSNWFQLESYAKKN